MKRITCLVLIAAFLIMGIPAASAEDAYSSYTYDFWGEPIPAPNAYVASRLVDGMMLGIGEFKSPSDIFVSPSNKIYIADSGNNRIVVMDHNWNMVKVIDKFTNNGKEDAFLNPRGLFVTKDEELYVADTDHARIVHLDAEGNFVREIGPPVADIIPADFKYLPTSLVVDKAERIYVVALGVNQGVIELDSQGNFKGYMGASKVTPNMADYFWKMISTDEQRQRQELFVPTEYNNINIDSDGFVYVTTSSLALADIQNAINSRSTDDRGAPVRKLNPTGQDILRRYGYYPPVGDVRFYSRGYAEAGNSQLIDVTIEDYGIYSVLDNKRGRIFTYDGDSNLLYVFGGIGNRLGTFRNPAGLAVIDGNYAVIDSTLGYITIFEPTDYGKLVKEAVTLHQQGKYDESASKWQQVLKYNANSELAYIGMGKAYLRQDDFKMAMKYFRLGNKRDYYSKAFQLYREQVIGDNFGYIVTLILIAALGLWFYSKRKARREVEA